MELTGGEAAAFEAFRAGRSAATLVVDEDGAWVTFCLTLLQEAGRILRSARLTALKYGATEVEDGVAITDLEAAVSSHVRAALEGFNPNTPLLSEDQIEVPQTGSAVALDAIDGVRSFLTHAESCSISLALFRDGEPRLSMILNPVTGEVGYGIEAKARLLQLPLFGEEPVARDLPLVSASPSKPLLVNMHTYKDILPFQRAVFDGWSSDLYKINVVKATTGSPSWSLLEAAKGHFVYVNIWNQATAAPHDLVPGLHLLRCAGGEVVALDGTPIPLVGHKGVFVAGVQESERESVIGVMRSVKANLDMLYGLL
jgi:fructose-1,6-bisphosphatase/inositol monophosphatase family enzyme